MPLHGNLHGIAKCAPGLDTCFKILLEAFGDSFLIGPDVNRLAQNARLRLKGVPGQFCTSGDETDRY
jgi:hypothetical protein